MTTKKVINLRIALVMMLIVLSLFSIHIGIEEFSIIGLFNNDEKQVDLFLLSRLPRLLSVIITGVSLSIAGLIMQTISANKFVSPTTAGTLDWARLGILLSFFVVGAASSFVRVLFSFGIAMLGTGIFMMILTKTKFRNSAIVPLIGLMLGNVVTSITTFIAYRFDLIQNMSSWLMGSFTLVTKGNYELLYLGIPFMILAIIYASKFTIASMGQEISTGLGLNHKMIMIIGLVIVAVITAIMVVTVGTIPFVGLIVPNLVSLYRGDNVKSTIVETGLIGAILLLVGDIISRILIFPYQISISVVMSVMGSLIFLFIMFRKKSRVQ
jgi:iron complex transport system permease protein